MKKNLNRWQAAALFAAPFLFTIALASCGQSADGTAAPSSNSGGATITKASLTCIDKSCSPVALTIHDTSGGGNPKLFYLRGTTTVAIPANTEILIEVAVNDSTAH
jgi:hypothetical protein